VGDDELLPVPGELGEARAVHVQGLHDLLKALLDLVVHLGRRKVDEARGEVSQEAFEPYGLVRERLGLGA